MALMAKAMGVKVGNSLRKLVLLKLADNANDKGQCWPSHQHIADQCECSKSAVRNHIDALEEMGLLTRENRLGTNNGKGNTSNVYYLNLDAPPMPLKSTGLCQQITHPVPLKSIGVCQLVAPPMLSGDTPPMPPDGTRTSHSFEPVKEPKEYCQADELPDDLPDPVLRVLKHLSVTTRVDFKAGKTTLGFINGLLVGEYVAEELILVIDHRVELWMHDPKMSQYLSPKTLFNFENFERYLPFARKWHEDGRPPLSSKPVVKIDTEERDIARKRFLGSSVNIMQKSAIEFATRKSAATAGIKNMSPEAAKRIWDKLWQENAQRIHDNEKIKQASA